MSTQCSIFAPSRLHRAAWESLVKEQPGISVVSTFGDFTTLERSPLSESTTLLVDVPELQADFVVRLRQASPGNGLLFLVSQIELAEVVALLQAGATGLIYRDAAVGELARAIIAVARGEVVLPPTLAAKALVALARGEVIENGDTTSLTDREEEVLELLSTGLTNKDIAQTLFLSVRTVEAHLHNIYGKLGVSSRTEAALWAVNHGFGA